MKKFFAILLASFILFMNVGFMVSKHYCGGELTESALTLGYGNLGCGMEEEQTPCQKSEEAFKKKNCCENNFLQLQIDDDYKKTAIQNPNVDFKFVTTFVISYVDFSSFYHSKKTKYFTYSPPLLARDIQLMNQSFLI